MLRVQNPELASQIMNMLRSYYIENRQHELHVSDIIYCLTRSYFDKIDPLPPTDEEVLLFALGLGLQRVLIPKAQDAPTIEIEGVIFSPDFITVDGHLAELKTTRQSSRMKNASGSYEPSPFSETWVEQMMGYVAASVIDNARKGQSEKSSATYELAVLRLMGSYNPPFPSLEAWKVGFDDVELADYWSRFIDRKATLLEALEKHTIPAPYIYCREWECKNCRYSLRCSNIAKA